MKLARTMTVAQFDNGYWYATQLKAFAKALGIPQSHRLRKDQLESAIKRFLTSSGKTTGAGDARPEVSDGSRTGRATLSSPGLRKTADRGETGGLRPGVSDRSRTSRDVDRGLTLDLPVVRYTNDRETKAFLEREAARMSPGVKRVSGARYRLNRWRDARLEAGEPITYRDVVAEYVRLCSMDEPFTKIPVGRYINFVAEYLAKEPGATREQAIAAWHELKRLDVPKDYASFKATRGTRRRPTSSSTKRGPLRASPPRQRRTRGGRARVRSRR